MAQPSANDSALLALSFLEAILLEDGRKIQALARSTDPRELGEMFSVVSKITAALLESSLGVAGAIEKIHRWRAIYLNPAEASEWVE